MVPAGVDSRRPDEPLLDPDTDVQNSSIRSSAADAEQLTLLGIDFSWAPLEERERLTYTADTAVELLARAKQIEGIREATVLSTCNRTEFYLVGSSGVANRFLELVRATRPGSTPRSSGCEFRRASDVDAVRHAFRVASGIASTILGDAFIVKQMKEALALASAAGTLGPLLSRLFQQAFETARLARRTTGIGRGESSVGAVVAAAIEQKSSAGRVLLIGAGTTARDIGRQLQKRRVGLVTVVNRTDERAATLARAIGARSALWNDLEVELTRADAVICATASHVPIVRERMLGGRHPFLVDCGVPRNIEPPPAVTCLTIDDLVARQESARMRRELAIPAVEVLIDEALERWRRWVETRPIEVMLRDFFNEEAETRGQLAAELVAQGWPPTASEVERLLAKRTGGLLKRHAAQLRRWAAQTRSHATVSGEGWAHKVRS